MTWVELTTFAEAHRTRMEFLDSQFASIRLMIYQANAGKHAPNYGMDHFRMLGRSADPAEQIDNIESQLGMLATEVLGNDYNRTWEPDE